MNQYHPTYRILFASMLILLFACKTEPVVPPPNPVKVPNISLENPLFVAEDSCRPIPLPPTGGLGEYNEFPNPYLTKTVSYNPENPCEYLARITATDPLDQFYMLVDICEGTAIIHDIFSIGANAFPVWGPHEWFLFARQNEIWKIKSNGDSLQLVIPKYGTKHYYNIYWDPTDENYFFFNQESTSFRADIWGNHLDTLDSDFIWPGPDNKTLGSVKGESIGYYDLISGEYVSVSNKYDREFGGAWLPDGAHFIWLVMENAGSYPISLVEFNISTKEERVIKEWSCYNRTYSNPKVTQDGKWVYMHLQYAESLGGRDLFADWFTAFVNIETGEEYWGAFEPK